MSKNKTTEIKCAYCGKVRTEVKFMIGASVGPEWTMHEGTAKMSCDNEVCWEKGRTEGRAASGRHTGIKEA